MLKIRILALAIGLAVLGVGFGIGVQDQPASAASLTEAQRVIRWGKNQVGKNFRLGAIGLRRYDCSGLVFRTFYETGLSRRIGGHRTSRGYYKWFRERGLVTRNPRPGDLVVWGKRGQPVSHIGIYLGTNRYGQRIALSSLITGVAVHKVGGINLPVRAYLRVRIDR